jgi:hypothetical protein
MADAAGPNLRCALRTDANGRALDGLSQCRVITIALAWCGSGKGPEYTGRLRVTGSDPYDLDRDGNGVGRDWSGSGCTSWTAVRSGSANKCEVGIDTYCRLSEARRIRASVVASETSIEHSLEPVKHIEGMATALTPGRTRI